MSDISALDASASGGDASHDNSFSNFGARTSTTLDPATSTTIERTTFITSRDVGITTVTAPITVFITSASTPTPTSKPSRSPSSGLSGGDIAGIVIGVLVASAWALGTIWYYFRRLARKRRGAREQVAMMQDVDGEHEKHEMDGYGLAEVDGRGRPWEAGGGAVHEMMAPPSELEGGKPPAKVSFPVEMGVKSPITNTSHHARD